MIDVKSNDTGKVKEINEESLSVKYLVKKDARLKKLIGAIGPISYVLHNEEAYSFLVHEIIEQMLSMKAGTVIFNRLVELCGGVITPEAINQLSDEDIKGVGTANSKVKCIRCLTNSVLNGDIDFDKLSELDDGQVMEALMKIKGIGKWTAKMFLIFSLDRQDVLPYEDVAFLQAFT